MKQKPNELLIAAKLIYDICLDNFKPHSSKFSKKAYTQPQLAALICLKVMFNMTYRDFTTHISLMPPLLKKLELKAIPHHTTLVKAARRIGQDKLNKLMKDSANLIESSGEGSIDSTCFQKGNASEHYLKRCGMKVKSQKACVVVDTKTKVILGLTITGLRTHDTKLAYRVLNPLFRWLTLLKLRGDKGFDAEHLRMFLRQNSVLPLIKYRIFEESDKLLNEALKALGSTQRAMSETVNSSVKRKLGDRLRSIDWFMQIKEIKIKAFVYNVGRYVSLFCVFAFGKWSLSVLWPDFR